jgi:hypothetical protein
MRNVLLTLLLGVFFLEACVKEPPEAQNLPESVELGKSVVFLNGEIAPGYEASFIYLSSYKTMSYVFVDSFDLIVNVFGFDWLPLSTGNFDLHDEDVLYIKANTGFSQAISEDFEGYSYKLEDPEEGFLEVQELDTIQKIAKGRFKAKFKRTSKNGNEDLGIDLPKILLFQGVFHDRYEVH